MTRTPFLAPLYGLIALGIVIYGVAEENPALTVAALVVWAAAWPVSLSRRGKPMPRLAIAMAVVAATAHLVLSLTQRPGELVMIVSTYLLWLQVIKLYDRAELRDQGQLIAMSVALVIGACLTSVRLLLGVLLLVYVPLLLWTAAMFQIHAGRVRVAVARAQAGAAVARAPQRAEGRALRRAMTGVIGVSSVAIAVLTAAGFVLLPRSSASDDFSRLLFSSSAITGFDDEVLLGSAGLLSESQVAVLDLSISDAQGAAAWPDDGRVYLRGAALDEYESGRWRTGTRRRSQLYSRIIDTPDSFYIDDVDPERPVYVQRIEFRDKQKPQLFTTHRPVWVEVGRLARVQYNSVDQTMTMDATGGVSYTVASQPELLLPAVADAGRMPALFQGTRVHEETLRLLDEADLSRDPEPRHTEDDAEIARAIERHLWMRCLYTTEMIAPQRGEDPIEMFLFRTQQGHCEYFASAMAAMLRSVGIDARVVTGYVVTDRPADGQSVVVRESDAHAWVEALIAPGVWRTYDPSPPLDLAALRVGPTGVARWLRDAREAMQSLWASAVVGYTRERQEEVVGEVRFPLRDRIAQSIEDAGSGVRASPVRAATSALMFGVMVFALVAIGGFAGRAAMRRVRAWLRLRAALRAAAGGDDELRRRLTRTSFYLAASARLRRAGLGRPSWMHPREHADRLAAVDASLSRAVRAVVDLYYQARFAQRTLTDEDIAAAGTELDTIRERLRHVRAQRRAAKRG